MTTSVVVTLRHTATHYWPDVDPMCEERYLRHEHRHVFHITAKKQVQHDDRDIEIIAFKSTIKQFLRQQYGGSFGSMSCEMIARALMREFGLSYCQVLEDGENGAEINK